MISPFSPRRDDAGLSSGATAQGGMALAVGLILLVLVTLIGLAAVRSTTAQQKMTANFYDRELAFQNAEAALRAGQTAITACVTPITRNCSAGTSVACRADPFSDPNLPANLIQTVAATTYEKGIAVASQPQYVIECLGEFQGPTASVGFNQTANALQYGAQGISGMRTFYRVSARSGDPATVGERSVVMLQAIFMQ